MRYPLSPVTSGQLFSLSVRGWWQAIRSIFLFIFIFVVLKGLHTHLPALPNWLEWICSIILVLIAIFLYACSLYRVDAEWKGQPLSLIETWRLTQKSILKLYLACLGIVAALVLVFLLVHWLTFSIAKLQGVEALLAMMLFAAIPLIFILIYFYLMLPLLTIYEAEWYLAFSQSAVYARENLKVMLLIYFEAIVMLWIASSATRHGQWLVNHHFMELSDLVVFSLIVPLWLNLTLLLLHNWREGEGKSS